MIVVWARVVVMKVLRCSESGYISKMEMMRFVNELDFGQIRKKFCSELQEDFPFKITRGVSGMVAKRS